MPPNVKNMRTDCKVYVGNLGNTDAKHELESAFSKYGPLVNVWVARNPPGFAFVEFEDPRDAEDAVRALDGTRMCGVRVKVEMSTGRSRRDRFHSPPRRGGGGRRSRSRSPRRYGGRGRSRSRSPRRSRSRSPREESQPGPCEKRQRREKTPEKQLPVAFREWDSPSKQRLSPHPSSPHPFPQIQRYDDYRRRSESPAFKRRSRSRS
ncbi:RNA-binding protein 1-like isoform X3 [Macrobrachium nipponense]|uniref:RNA-binding protein 1-like isoform X3 n=1 Tax=Macrobrachium nipponense TaxID=159736 RepID=UPI0030C8C260